MAISESQTQAAWSRDHLQSLWYCAASADADAAPPSATYGAPAFRRQVGSKGRSFAAALADAAPLYDYVRHQLDGVADRGWTEEEVCRTGTLPCTSVGVLSGRWLQGGQGEGTTQPECCVGPTAPAVCSVTSR